MVVKFDFHHVFRYPWEQVTATHLTKYPNEKEPNVRGTEVIQRSAGPGSLTYLRYIVTCVNVLPSILRKVEALKTEVVQYEEECWIYRDERLMKVKSRNLSLTQYAEMVETSTYRPAKANTNWTEFEQNGLITVKGLGPANWLIEMFVKKFFEMGMRKNTKFIEDLIEERYSGKPQNRAQA